MASQTELQGRLEELQERLRDLEQQVGKSMVDGTLSDKVHDAVDYAGDKIHDSLEIGKQKAKDTAYKVKDLAEENPWHTAAIAAAVGFLLASVVNRRKD